MKSLAFAAMAAAMTLSMAVPALAQMGSSSTSSMGSSSMSTDSMPATCQGMMDKANGMSPPADATKKAMAMKEMDMAKAAMAKGQEKTCQMHMKKAMQGMM